MVGEAQRRVEDNEDDARLIERLVAGDRHALGTLYDRYGSLLLGLGCKMLRSQEEAEDVLHDVFMEAWRKAKTYDPTRGTVRAWLALRMRSRVLDRIRAPARKRAVSADDIGEAAVPELIAGPGPTPKLKTEERRFAAALSSLGDELETIVRMVYFDGRSLAQVSKSLDIPVGTVKSRLFAARARLREQLGEEEQS